MLETKPMHSEQSEHDAQRPADPEAQRGLREVGKRGTSNPCNPPVILRSVASTVSTRVKMNVVMAK